MRSKRKHFNEQIAAAKKRYETAPWKKIEDEIERYEAKNSTIWKGN